MAVGLTQNDFTAFVTGLRESLSLDDMGKKQTMAKFLPRMKAFAEESPIALYRLARFYSPTSPAYKEKVMQSADMGCTNAMLALCEVLFLSNTKEDLKTAVKYMLLIQNSQDSFINKEALSLLEAHKDSENLDRRIVVNYLLMIQNTDNVFMKNEAQSLLEAHLEKPGAVDTEKVTPVANAVRPCEPVYNPRFFAHSAATRKTQEPELETTLSLR